MRTNRCLVALLLLAIMALAGCASRPVNERLTQFDPNAGYRPYLLIPKRENNDPRTLFILAFSGGGTRAAAFSYGVLEELRGTEITVDGQRRRLIDEVDIITGVSGGSFTALAYALYGERLFSEYEQRFLKRDVQGDLVARALNPFNWWKYIGGSAGRSELAAEYYDEILFEGATFGDLLTKQAPVAVANGTDISTGFRFSFYQNDFDLLCSDLSKVRLSRAAATSSAVPVVLSAVTFDNYGGTCGYEYPAWARDVAKAEGRARPSARVLQRYREMQQFQDSKDRPYIHLVDGGVADNIGMRSVLEALEAFDASKAFRGDVGFGAIRRIVLIVVNSRSAPKTDWDRDGGPSRPLCPTDADGRGADRPLLVRNHRDHEGPRGDLWLATRDTDSAGATCGQDRGGGRSEHPAPEAHPAHDGCELRRDQGSEIARASDEHADDVRAACGRCRRPA